MGSDEKNIIWMETNSKSKKDCFGYRYPAKNKFVMEKNDRDFKLNNQVTGSLNCFFNVGQFSFLPN